MGQSLPLNTPTSLRIVIGDAETWVSSVGDVVKFLRQQEAGDLADFMADGSSTKSAEPRRCVRPHGSPLRDGVRG